MATTTTQKMVTVIDPETRDEFDWIALPALSAAAIGYCVARFG